MKKLKFFFVIILLTCNSVGAQLIPPLMPCCCRIVPDPATGYFFYYCWLQSSLLDCCPEYGFNFTYSYLYTPQGVNTGVQVYYANPELISSQCPSCSLPV